MKNELKRELPSIFDLKEDPDGVLRMPFKPIDYGEHNTVLRPCCLCGGEKPQGEMKELHTAESNLAAIVEPGADRRKWYDSSVFYCRECWFSNDISDARKWVA